MLKFRFLRGSWSDFLALQRFHYCQTKPATVAGVWIAVHQPRAEWGGEWGEKEEVAGVVVLSNPSALCRERRRVFGLEGMSKGEQVRFANGNLRTISRLIVHPRYRGVGVARELVRVAVEACPTGYVEARARLGHALPVFERAGMVAEATEAGRPAYFWSRAGGGQVGAGGLGGGDLGAGVSVTDKPHSGQRSRVGPQAAAVARRS